MSRQGYEYFQQTDFRGGVCLEPENARPNQLLRGKNVWAPDGRLETRPGYEGISYNSIAYASVFPVNALYFDPPSDLIRDNNKIEFTSGSKVVDNYFYFLVNEDDENPTSVNGIILKLQNTWTPPPNVGFFVEYWNGIVWLPLRTTHTVIDATLASRVFTISEEGVDSGFFLEPPDSFSGTPEYAALFFAAPQKWATLTFTDTVSSSEYTGYPLRVGLIPNDNSEFNSTTDFVALYYFVQVNTVGSTNAELKLAYAPQFASGKRYIYGIRFTENASPALMWIDNESYVRQGLGFSTGYKVDSSDVPWSDKFVPLTEVARNEPASYANVPLFDECFVSYDYTITKHKLDGTSEIAQVESEDFLVGDGFLYADESIAKLSQFPRAKYITFFDNALWAANIEGATVQLRWSAPAPYHNAWPQVNFENIMENDNSPITGIATLGENLIVFKNDSIWQMVFTGLNEVELAVYAPRQIVRGIGCVSNSSIANTPAGLMFLAEDGVYLFNGTPQVQKISEPIEAFFERVYAPRRPFATAVHWRTQNCYLLALSVDASTENNVVLCYDYTSGAWWEWDNMPVELWMVDESTNDNEEIYFSDTKGNLYRLGGTHDHGATITADILTHRMGFGDFLTKDFRELRINSSNSVDTLNIELLVSDEEEDYGTSGSLSYYDDNEEQWGAAFGGDVGHIVADGTALPTSTGSISTAQHDMPGGRNIHIYYRENKATTGGTLASGGVSTLVFTLVGYDEDNGALSETITLTPDQPFGISTNLFYKVTSLSLTTLSTVSSGIPDAEYAVGYGPGGSDFKWWRKKRREKRWGCREQGEWAQVKLTSADFGNPLELHRISLGYRGIGRR